MITVKRTFDDGSTETKEFKDVKSARLNKGKKKVTFLQVLETVSNVVLFAIKIFGKK